MNKMYKLYREILDTKHTGKYTQEERDSMENMWEELLNLSLKKMSKNNTKVLLKDADNNNSN